MYYMHICVELEDIYVIAKKNKKNTSKHYIIRTIQKYIKTIIETETKSLNSTHIYMI